MRYGAKFVQMVMLLSSVNAFSGMPVVSFDESMQVGKFPSVMQYDSAQHILDYFRQLYIKNAPAVIKPSTLFKIPKIIHHIWLGGKLPEAYTLFRQSWIAYHPGWTFIFWTDNPINYDQGDRLVTSFDELAQLLEDPTVGQFFVVDVAQLVFDNRRFFDETSSYGERSDILRWEVVLRFGGLYVDTDYECLKSLEELHCLYDFYTGIQPLDTNYVQLGAAIFAAVPNHPIMQHCVRTIKDDRGKPQIIIKTGPFHFTKSFLLNAGKGSTVDIALPASYFYPCGYTQDDTDVTMPWKKPESYAIHHWAGSWLKPEAFAAK